jgi:hypothetical protein
LDEGRHTVAMRRADHRTDNCVGLRRIAPLQGRTRLEQQRYERLAAIIVHDDAAVGGAALTRHFEGAGRHGARGCSEISVGPDDGGIVATKLGLERNVLLCANFLRRPSGGEGASDRHRADARFAHQCLAFARATFDEAD